MADQLSKTEEQGRLTIIHDAILSDDSDIAYAGLENLGYLPDSERAALLDLRPDLMQPVKDFAGKTPLYADKDSPFLKEEFKKDGSRTVLLDVVPGDEAATLKERVIRRIIPLGAYLTWEKVYEAGSFWEEKGFDYVPIEPIVRVRQNSENSMLTDVSTRVISGPSFGKWKKTQGAPYVDEIEKQVGEIKKNLDELGIDHGHLHDGNFVLLFERASKTGAIDLTHPPRVYAIDFDQSQSKMPLNK